MKKLSALLLMAVLLVGCGSAEGAETKGSGKSKASENGDYATAEVTMKGDKITDIDLDELKDGKSKKELGDDYGMKKTSGIKKEWDEQTEFLEDYIEKNGIDAVELKEDGYPKNDDVLAGCTYNLTNVMEAAKDAVKNAK